MPETIRGAVLALDARRPGDRRRGDRRRLSRRLVTRTRRNTIFRRDGRDARGPAPAAAAGAVYLAVRAARAAHQAAAACGRRSTSCSTGRGGASRRRSTELWGDFHQYGANVALPDDGPVTITVQVGPPAYARHGDMLNSLRQPGDGDAAGARARPGALAFDASP